MPPDANVLELTVRGIALSDDTVHYVRRCNRRLVEQVGIHDRRVQVLLERARLSEEAHAWVALADGANVVRARGRDLDVLIAVREAFDRLTRRLLERRPVAHTPLACVDVSVAMMRLAARLGRRSR